MDFSTVTADQWGYVAVVFVGMALGKALSIETRILTGLLLAALLAPANFVPVALAIVVSAIVVKVMFQFQHWV